jgi:uncharacterized OsmC-like protein
MSSALDPSFYKIARRPSASPARGDRSATATTAVRVEIRALDGMQKEAIVTPLEPGGSAWRMVSDEGPYLNGTDLAPFPLAFFTAGQQLCLMSELLRLAAARDVELHALAVGHDNRYTMSGSMLRGDMTGGALPAETVVALTADASAREIARLVRDAASASPGQAVMRDVLANRFSLTCNGRDVAVEGVCQSAARAADPTDHLAALAPADPGSYRSGIMTKSHAVEATHGVAGGVGSSLKPELGRTLLETTIQLFQPLGSSFTLLSDLPVSSGGGDAAPPPLAYLAAGVGFCFMTQLGRYAHITQETYRGVRICQDSRFRWIGDRATADPIDTHVFLETPEGEPAARRLVTMGEQTCFLHAAMRAARPSTVRLELNGSPVALEG